MCNVYSRLAAVVELAVELADGGITNFHTKTIHGMSARISQKRCKKKNSLARDPAGGWTSGRG
jgi:hypothetical protein